MRSLLLAAFTMVGLSFATACATTTEEASSSDSNIVGGVEANGAALNAIGSIGNKGADGSFTYFCTATLIAPDLVLTAKHCATEGPPENHRYLDDDAVYFAVGPDSTKPLETVKAKNVVLSPINEGGFVEYGSDVSIYILDQPITDVKPLRVATGSVAQREVGTIFTAVGFGVRDRERNSGQRRAGAVTLRAATGKPLQAMFENKDAFISYLRDKEGDDYIAASQSGIDKLWDLTLMESYEAYLGLGKDDSQPCSGDSGGPLVRKAADGQLEVAAVVSGSFKGWKYPCSLVGETYATFGPKVQELLRDTRACKGVPIEGSCDGTAAVRCVSDAEGPQKVTRTDCGLIDQVCKVDATTKKAGCADPDPPANDAGVGEGGSSGGDAGSDGGSDSGAADAGAG
jgi:hypothetical protein